MKTEEEIEKVYYTPCEVRKMYNIRTHYELTKIVKEWGLPHFRPSVKTFRFHKNHLTPLKKAIEAKRKIKDITAKSKEKLNEAVLFRKNMIAKYAEKINKLQKEKAEVIKDISDDIIQIQKEEVRTISKIIKAVRKVNNDPPV